MSRVVVVGGGIAGLAAARELAQAGVAEITVLEGGPRFGGKLAAIEVDGVRLDGGAESVLARRPEATTLIDDLGIAGRRVHPTPAKSQVLIGGRARSLPPSVLGVPQDLDRLEGYLSTEGLRRARREPELPAPALAGDVGIGSYVDERFGPEVTTRLLEPLLGGVYAGQARQLSFEAVSPALFARARRGGSLLAHAQTLTSSAPHGPVFAGLAGGISTVVDVLVAELQRRGITLRLGVTVRELEPTPTGYRLVCGAVPTPEIITADAVVLATPAGATGRLLADVGPVAAEFAAIPYASTALVTLAVAGTELNGSGLLVPPGELPTIKALTYSSNKWDWVARAAEERWGSSTAVVRVSVGRIGEAPLLQLGDEALRARTLEEAKTLPDWAGARLVAGHVTRWGGALPQYLVGHRDLVARLRDVVTGQPGLALCGAALDGVGVAACLASATTAVAKIVADLGGAESVATIERQHDLERKN